jgi:HEPN domain-containing protein
MNPLTLEWIQKAEGDYAAAEWLQQATAPIHDAICFHAQQCVEKYLKAWLQEANIPFPRSHDLEELLNLIVPIVPAWDVWRSDLQLLTAHAVDFRYPGNSATVNDADHTMQLGAQVRQAIRTHLGLPI